MIMNLDPTNDEAAALARLPRHAIGEDRYTLSPRLALFKAILAKPAPPELRRKYPSPPDRWE
jgi:hypothetical protein